MRKHLLVSALLVSLLAACSSTPKPEESSAGVEDRGAGSSSSVARVDATQPSGTGIAALRDPKNILSKREVYFDFDSYVIKDDYKALVEARTLRQRVEQDNAELQENIMDLLQVVSQASEGDLSVRAKVSAGALGNVADAFNHLLESQRVLIGEILEQLRLTNDTVISITRSSKDMATGATQQTHEILGAVSSVQAICSEIERVSSNARTAAEAAKRTQESALEGARGVQSIVNGMASLRASVQAGAKKMKSLGDRSMEITGIVSNHAPVRWK